MIPNRKGRTMFDTSSESRLRSRMMSRRRVLMTMTFLTIVLIIFARASQAQSTTFMYQGKLTDTSAPANGLYDLEFKLYDAVGGQVGPIVTREDVQVTDGLFTVPLEIGVRPGSSTGSFSTLAPRQPISSSPYAIQTINAAQLGGVPADQYVK